MSGLLVFYLCGAALFLVADAAASHIVGMKHRVVASLTASVAWPLMLAVALIGSAIIIRRMKDELARIVPEGGGDGR